MKLSTIAEFFQQLLQDGDKEIAIECIDSDESGVLLTDVTHIYWTGLDYPRVIIEGKERSYEI